MRGKAAPDGDGLLSIGLGLVASGPAASTIVFAQTGLQLFFQRRGLIVRDRILIISYP
jgi:hypothetical protein